MAAVQDIYESLFAASHDLAKHSTGHVVQASVDLQLINIQNF